MTLLAAKNITIVGTGLLGGSLGLALRAAGFDGRIVGVGRREATLRRAVEVGCIDEGTTELRTGVAGSELIVLATPVTTAIGVLGELSRLRSELADDVVITDLGSTKQGIVEASERVLTNGLISRFVGGHPMAGREVSGPDGAIPGLFSGKPVILTPTERTEADALNRVEQLWRILGMRIVRMSAAEHDKTVARISHLPHAVAVLMVELAAARGGLEVASTGFADSTRVASGEPAMWADIFLSNAAAMDTAVDEFIAEMLRFRTMLREGDRQKLTELLSSVKLMRDAWAGERDTTIERTE